jgi:transcriptional regulator with XRE-family HTH domain
LKSENYYYFRYRKHNIKMKKEKLISIRKAKKISQTDIATYLKISQTQYQKRESGKIIISNEEWKRIAQLLEVDVDEIFDSNSEQTNEKTLKEELLLLREKIKNLEEKLLFG